MRAAGFRPIFLGVFAVTIRLSVGLLQAQENLPAQLRNALEETPATETASPTPEGKVAEIKPGGMIDKMMTREQRTAAGLDKLSPAEIDYFAQWLRNYRRAAEQKTAEKAVEAAKAGETTATTQQRFLGRDKIVSRVDGTMGPLTGNTVIRLEDGTKWKQANSEDRFRPRVTDAPSVAIFRTAFGYLMRIEGMPDFYVEPVQQ